MTHAEIVVGTPDGDFLLLAIVVPDGTWKGTDYPFKICKNSIAPFGMYLVYRFLEKSLIVHPGFLIFAGIIIATSTFRLLPQDGQIATLHFRSSFPAQGAPVGCADRLCHSPFATPSIIVDVCRQGRLI
jgi:hypothetical protein